MARVVFTHPMGALYSWHGWFSLILWGRYTRGTGGFHLSYGGVILVARVVFTDPMGALQSWPGWFLLILRGCYTHNLENGDPVQKALALFYVSAIVS